MPLRIRVPRLEVIEATLDNGLRVRLLPDDSVPICSLYLVFRVGTRHERPGIIGISHLFEHMYFNGADKYGHGEFDRVLEGLGGESNAYTTHDETVYHESFASEALETVLDLEAEPRLSRNYKSLLPLIDNVQIDEVPSAQYAQAMVIKAQQSYGNGALPTR